MGAKSIETHMDLNVRLCVDQSELLSSTDSCQILVGKLNYLAITRPDIAFVVTNYCQFMSAPCSTHMEAEDL